MINVPWLRRSCSAGPAAAEMPALLERDSARRILSFAGGEEKRYFAPNDETCRAANPAEALLCGNTGI